MTPTFIVSGGARGVTAACTIKLASIIHGRYILLGRTPLADAEPTWASGKLTEAELRQGLLATIKASGEKRTPAQMNRDIKNVLAQREIHETLSQIATVGSQAEYHSVNITDAVAVQELVQQVGTVTGIIHGAGVLADKLIEQKTADDFERVLSTKVDGLHNLLQAVALDKLDYLVLFSSAAGYYGNIGQSDYAMANEILNKMAYHLQQQGIKVISLDWGPWDGGMVTPALKAQFEERGVDIIPVDVGAHIMVEAMLNPTAPTQMLVGNPMSQQSSLITAELETHRIQRSLADNPFLQDHRIGEHAVLPVVHALAWMANIAENLYPGYHFFSAQDFKVLKGIVFDETIAETYILDLKETSKSEDEIQFEAVLWSHNPNGKLPFYHYRSQITLVSQVPTPPTYPSIDLSLQNPIDGAQLYTDGTLFHGRLFQGVEQVLNISPQKMTVKCRVVSITDAEQGQFPIQTFNPYVADVQFQAMLIWARHFHGSASLPLSAAGGEQFAPIPDDKPFYVTLAVQDDNDYSVVADVFIHDAQGTIYSQVRGAAVTLSPQLNTLFAS